MGGGDRAAVAVGPPSAQAGGGARPFLASAVSSAGMAALLWAAAL